MKKQRTTVYFERTLHQTLKEFCKKKNLSMTDFVESLVSKALNKN
jgi:hypothetical protein